MTTYYISPTGSDSNAGTSSTTAFATFSHANSLLVAGDTVLVEPGTYAFQVDTETKSGTALNRITWKSVVKWGAKLTGDGVQNDAWFIQQDYNDIIGFDISNPLGTHGINNYGNHTRVIGCRIHDVSTGVCVSNGGAGIFHGLYTTTGCQEIGNIIYNIGPSTTCTGTHGIYHSNELGSIQNNIVFNVSDYGIHLWHAANNCVVSGNLVFGARTGGILIGNDGATSGSVLNDNTLVSNNIVFNNGIYGIREFGSFTGVHNKYINNLVFGNPTPFSLLNLLLDSFTVAIDPQFVNFQANGTGNYHLKSTSPARGAGTPAGMYPTDIEGFPRPFNNVYDIGPYQYLPYMMLTGIGV